MHPISPYIIYYCRKQIYVKGAIMIYLDNSSTTRKKPFSVIKSMILGITKYSANPGRGSHKYSLQANEKIIETRIKLSEYFNLPNIENVIFTSGCTESINMALIGTARKNGHIITTYLEHNSVLRTITHLTKSHGITYTLIKPDNHGNINPHDIEAAINDKTYMIVINHTSNVIGSTQDITTIGSIAKKRKLIFMVDSAQSGGHEKIDMMADNINLLCGTAHKGFYGPQGVGFLLINNVRVSPIKFGGTGTNSYSIIQPTDYPDSLESGTGPNPNILGLYSGISFVEKRADRIKRKINSLSNILLDYLSHKEEIVLYSSNPNSGVIAFNVKGVDSSTIVNILNDKYKICVRGGLQCAPKVHEFLGTITPGVVRISLSYYNKLSEIKKFIKSMESMLNKGKY